MTPATPLYTEREAAAYLGYSPRWIGQLRRAGLGPEHLVLRGRTIRYRLEALESWAAAGGYAGGIREAEAEKKRAASTRRTKGV